MCVSEYVCVRECECECVRSREEVEVVEEGRRARRRGGGGGGEVGAQTHELEQHGPVRVQRLELALEFAALRRLEQVVRALAHFALEARHQTRRALHVRCAHEYEYE